MNDPLLLGFVLFSDGSKDTQWVGILSDYEKCEYGNLGTWYINPLNTGGTSNVCLLTKFCRLATACGVIIHTKFQNNWILGNCFFNGVHFCRHW